MVTIGDVVFLVVFGGLLIVASANKPAGAYAAGGSYGGGGYRMWR